MLSFLVVLVLVLGLNTMVWTLVGLGRTVARGLQDRAERDLARRAAVAGPGDALHGPRPVHGAPRGYRVPTTADVAVLIAAHDEELVIERTIRSAVRHLPPEQVLVVSDGSTDRTVEIARAAGAQVYDLQPNRGKAGAIAAAVEYFAVPERFEVMMLLDADTHLSDDYFATGLAQFDTPDVVAVAGRATTITDPRPPTLVGRLLVAYRERVYVAVQYLQKFGQAARTADVVAIVPGFASMYRTRVLRQIDITAEGLAIEDFNMTFEVHAKRLGRVSFRPGAAIAHTQDPDTLRDYAKQVRRWNLGFWQTLRRHRFGLRRFGLATALFVFELVTSSVMMLFLPPVLALAAVAALLDAAGAVGDAPEHVLAVVPVSSVLLGVLLPDYLLTVVVAVVTRRPAYLLLGVLFPLLRVLDSYLCLRALLLAFGSGSSGVWHSPTRRPATAV